jgi:hypothetical protein
VTSVRSNAPALAAPGGSLPERSGYGSALVVSVTIAIAAALLLLAILLLVSPPGISATSPYARLVNQQNQTVKTDVYLITFLVILPLSLLAGPRIADAIAAGPNSGALPSLAAALGGTLAAVLIVVKLSSGLPWGSGVKGVLAVTAAWGVLAGGALWRVLRGGRWRVLHRLQETWPLPVVVAALLVFGALLCVTSSASLGVVPLVTGAVATAVVLIVYRRARLPQLGAVGLLIDVGVVLVLALAIPDVVVFRNPTRIPNVLVDPGLVQFQQGFILGPTNQLLGGGALLVNDPVSQYGVGLIYFVAGWFHVAPIGYGTFGFLDGLLTALFYIAGYAVLRLAGVRRLLAVVAIALGVVAFVYNFRFFTGQLPEEGPLRFGLPMIVLLGAVAAMRLPRARTFARIVVFCGLGIAAVWGLEGLGYTLVTFAAVVVAEAVLRVPGARLRWLVKQVGLGVGAIVAAHVLFALATLAGSGHLPDWGQYLAYAHEFLLGGQAGSITYGFDNWSPGLAAYAGAIVSAAAVVLLLWRRRDLALANPARTVALAGSTLYAIAIFSYTDNRSSTYLFLYVALPLLLAGALWLSLILAPASALPFRIRVGGLTAALGVAVLLLAGAWPGAGTHFNRTALGHFYPGGGLRTALHRLWHPPAIDPLAPEGIRLVDRYIGSRKVVILLPTVPDLGTEILIRSHRSNLLPIGDPAADGLVPSVWLRRIRAAMPSIRPGQRILLDETALKIVRDLRKPGVDPLKAPIDQGGVEVEWILRSLDRRFEIRPLVRAPDGLIVATLVKR